MCLQELNKNCFSKFEASIKIYNSHNLIICSLILKLYEWNYYRVGHELLKSAPNEQYIQTSDIRQFRT